LGDENWNESRVANFMGRVIVCNKKNMGGGCTRGKLEGCFLARVVKGILLRLSLFFGGGTRVNVKNVVWWEGETTHRGRTSRKQS